MKIYVQLIIKMLLARIFTANSERGAQKTPKNMKFQLSYTFSHKSCTKMSFVMCKKVVRNLITFPSVYIFWKSDEKWRHNLNFCDARFCDFLEENFFTKLKNETNLYEDTLDLNYKKCNCELISDPILVLYSALEWWINFPIMFFGV